MWQWKTEALLRGQAAQQTEKRGTEFWGFCVMKGQKQGLRYNLPPVLRSNISSTNKFLHLHFDSFFKWPFSPSKTVHKNELIIHMCLIYQNTLNVHICFFHSKIDVNQENKIIKKNIQSIYLALETMWYVFSFRYFFLHKWWSSHMIEIKVANKTENIIGLVMFWLHFSLFVVHNGI